MSDTRDRTPETRPDDERRRRREREPATRVKRPPAGDGELPTRVHGNAGCDDAAPATQRLDETEATGATERMEDDPPPVSEGPAAGGLGRGSVLRGRFRIDGVLGEGGMGTVYKAVDLLKHEARDENVHVGLKVMKSGLFKADNMSFLGLQREARRAQQLAHPNIVTVYDFDRADGYIYMTMEYLDGKPLDRILKEHPHGLDRELARDITLQAGAGLAYAHREGIVHVDLKPPNIFVLDSGRTKILDFGIAKAYQSRRADFVEESLSGYSPGYASPQVIARERPEPSDDVFSLAIVVYAMYTGRHPFDWEPADEARKKGLRPAHDPAFRRAEWKAVRAALSFERADRPADAEAFVARFAPSRIKRAALAVSLGSVAAAAAFMLLYQPPPGPETPFEELPASTQARIESELDAASEFSSLGDINSALQLYDGVLNLHPGNREATRGMRSAVGAALERIDEARGTGAISPARAKSSLESMLAYETLPRTARERIEEELEAL